ncbi:MAG: hypothetical protein AB8H86_02400 [Polyangiales bacterium]
MPYRSDEEAWVRRNEEAEARAAKAEAALEELTAMKANTPWRHACAALVLLSLGAAIGWCAAPPEQRPGSFTALSTQDLALQSHARYTWRAIPTETTIHAARGEECTLSVDARDIHGVEGRSDREIDVRLLCGERRVHSSSHFTVAGRRIGACALRSGYDASLFCSIGDRSPRGSNHFYVDTRSGVLRMNLNGAPAAFELSAASYDYSPTAEGSTTPSARGPSSFESNATITHVSGIPSEGPLARPRIRPGADCRVLARSSNGARESRCEVEVNCGGTRLEASGVCAIDEVGQIERIVDLTVSQPEGQRGDENAALIFDVKERELVLMEDNGHEAFLVQLSLESSRSRARFL